MKEQIISFARSIIEHVRDDAIQSCNNQINASNLNSPSAKRYDEAIKKGDVKRFAEMIVSDSVDDTIFYLFNAIDNGLINLSINLPDGKHINLTEEGMGELAGLYLTEWRSEFSKERFFEDI